MFSFLNWFSLGQAFVCLHKEQLMLNHLLLSAEQAHLRSSL